MGEPSWTQGIPSSVICDTYYAFFVIYAIFATLAVLGAVGTFLGVKGVARTQLIAMSGGYFLSFIISGTLALFMYLICARSLLH